MANGKMNIGLKINNMEETKCKFCGSTELVYHQYIICDSKCQECGEWQNGDYLEDQDLSSTGSPYFHHKNKKDE